MSQAVPSEFENKLSSKQRNAALMLANGSTIEAASKLLRISDKTIDRWKHIPCFLAEVRRIEDELYNEQLSRIRQTMPEAIDCLKRNMGTKVTPYVQVQAASKLLDLAIQVRKMEELEKEIDALKLALDLKEDE